MNFRILISIYIQGNNKFNTHTKTRHDTNDTKKLIWLNSSVQTAMIESYSYI
jgi:hypothetical protein